MSALDGKAFLWVIQPETNLDSVRQFLDVAKDEGDGKEPFQP